ncbi:hypothetical protein AN639_08100 [Candidatus Epulonipiscium fishelsonii]|uniref:Uncharacterized protein n=1 Tax=Candidatus Epulonipiscium fishelsonii TaxID=77094 RepID=A0ACC8X9D9_9FIRM|nr:hypothetical protein AN639_08100 [Epulopiscium sp. SCG-B05WGA-EpuloA1]ONI38540.1 hypothetical protein AN396_10450 [Epulopiscium sp. SCG-B11WGA-EpuloA1]
MKKAVNMFNNIMSFMGMLCLVIFITSVLVQVISRTFLPKSPAWTEELARYSFIYMIAFGSSVAVRTKEFVSVDLLVAKFGPKFNRILNIIIQIGILGFCGYILVYSVWPFANIKYRMVSTAMQIPMQYVYLSMVLLFALLIVSYIFEIILTLTGQE